MPRRSRDLLAGVERVVVDGSNLLHALARRRAPLPPAALIGRIRSVIPAQAEVELVLDGTPEPGMRRTRVASGVRVRYAAPSTADAAILAATRARDPDARGGLLVVTDDTELRASIERHGGRTIGSRWLIGRLEREVLSAPAAGNPRSPGPYLEAAEAADAAPRWQPGRGATRKRGNPRRGHSPGR